MDKIIKKALGEEIKIENKHEIKDIDTLTPYQAYALVNTDFGKNNLRYFFFSYSNII